MEDMSHHSLRRTRPKLATGQKKSLPLLAHVVHQTCMVEARRWRRGSPAEAQAKSFVLRGMCSPHPCAVVSGASPSQATVLIVGLASADKVAAAIDGISEWWPTRGSPMRGPMLFCSACRSSMRATPTILVRRCRAMNMAQDIPPPPKMNRIWYHAGGCFTPADPVFVPVRQQRLFGSWHQQTSHILPLKHVSSQR